jgi:hypothetical protein
MSDSSLSQPNVEAADRWGQAKHRERPIIMSRDNPKLILEGRKTQTRRIIKPQPLPSFKHEDAQPGDLVFFAGKIHKVRESRGRNQRDAGQLNAHDYACPYGVAGDRLWVRETWWHEKGTDFENAAFSDGTIVQSDGDVFHIPDWEPKDKNVWKKRPSIHMPGWASRITLEITKVRVERLQDISQSDCEAEGMLGGCRVIQLYRAQWENLHGKGAWDKNPWVWVIEFRLSPKCNKQPR